MQTTVIKTTIGRAAIRERHTGTVNELEPAKNQQQEGHPQLPPGADRALFEGDVQGENGVISRHRPHGSHRQTRDPPYGGWTSGYASNVHGARIRADGTPQHHTHALQRSTAKILSYQQVHKMQSLSIRHIVRGCIEGVFVTLGFFAVALFV